MHYLPRGDESSPRGGWVICAPALPEVLTYYVCMVLHSIFIIMMQQSTNDRARRETTTSI
jgi:hypothetical protein